jgi:hypothetical protein
MTGPVTTSAGTAAAANCRAEGPTDIAARSLGNVDPRLAGSVPVRRWVAACAVAEMVGMTASALAARSADDLTRAGGSAYAALAMVVAGGLVEGCALGVLQAEVLRGVLGTAVARRWALVTTAVAGMGWAAASAPAAFAEQDPAGAAPPLWLVIGGAGALGAVMGLLLGAAQGAAIRHHVLRPWRWAQVSALAWTPAMVVIFVGATLPSAAWPTVAVVPMGAVTGLVAGTLLGMLSGPMIRVLDGVPVHNAVVLGLLSSPAHRALDRALIGLRVTGRVTGRSSELPVQYAEDDAGLVVLPGHHERKRWWRNLRGGADLVLLVGGSWRPGRGEVLTTENPEYAAAAATYRRRWPRASLPDGQPLVRISGRGEGGIAASSSPGGPEIS